MTTLEAQHEVITNLILENKKLMQERDETREALMKIEEIFIDGEDTYEDWKKMGNIAREALEK